MAIDCDNEEVIAMFEGLSEIISLDELEYLQAIVEEAEMEYRDKFNGEYGRIKPMRFW